MKEFLVLPPYRHPYKFLPPPAAPLSVCLLYLEKAFDLNGKKCIQNNKSVACCIFVYPVDEKKLADQIQELKKEKNDALTKVSALQKQVSPSAWHTLNLRAVVESLKFLSSPEDGKAQRKSEAVKRRSWLYVEKDTRPGGMREDTNEPH